MNDAFEKATERCFGKLIGKVPLLGPAVSLVKLLKNIVDASTTA